MLSNKTVVLGVTGGIVSYKSADIISKLTKKNTDVHVIMTENATKIISPDPSNNVKKSGNYRYV
jgi:phosphopantothenoylcysteine decarboxylase/phosphopantothenate--cysteine ligase